MVLAYRSDEDALQARLGSLLDERRAEVASTAAALRGIYASRVARAVAGGVASFGGATVLIGGAAQYLANGLSSQNSSGLLTALLVGSVAASALVYLPARAIGASLFSRALRNNLSLSGSARIDLVRVERAQPRRIARSLMDDSESISASLPLIGAALLAPLALHFLVWDLLLLFNGELARIFDGFNEFGVWIAMSAPLTGFAHVVLAVLCGCFGRDLGKKPSHELVASPAKEGWHALKITTLVGMFPGVVLILIPPVLVGLTGLLFIPLSFYAMSRAVVRERDAVDALGA